jgi:hypothetical protein
MATEIKAIETLYAGYRMRSRLEARYAVLFDTLRLEWTYEPEGYWVNNQGYLPDFFFPKLEMWAEVKPTSEALYPVLPTLKAFIQGMHAPMVFLVGVPDNIGYVMMSPGRTQPKNSTFRFDRLRNKRQVEAAVIAARSARFGKNGKG